MLAKEGFALAGMTGPVRVAAEAPLIPANNPDTARTSVLPAHTARRITFPWWNTFWPFFRWPAP